jgi:hypothetical protein
MFLAMLLVKRHPDKHLETKRLEGLNIWRQKVWRQNVRRQNLHGTNIKRDRTSRVTNVQRYKNVYGTKRVEGQNIRRDKQPEAICLFVIFSMYKLKILKST